MSNHLFILFLVLFTSSCHFSIHGVMSEHKRAGREAPALMESTINPPPLCEAVYKQERSLQVVTAEELKECLMHQPRAVVYQWATGCSGDESCYLPSVLQGWCTENSIELFVISEYYDNQYLKKSYPLERPILVVDHKYYKTPWIDGYWRKFRQELIASEDRVKDWKRLLYFEQGEFQGFYHYVRNIPISTATNS